MRPPSFPAQVVPLAPEDRLTEELKYIGYALHFDAEYLLPPPAEGEEPPAEVPGEASQAFIRERVLEGIRKHSHVTPADTARLRGEWDKRVDPKADIHSCASCGNREVEASMRTSGAKYMDWYVHELPPKIFHFGEEQARRSRQCC